MASVVRSSVIVEHHQQPREGASGSGIDAECNRLLAHAACSPARARGCDNHGQARGRGGSSSGAILPSRTVKACAHSHAHVRPVDLTRKRSRPRATTRSSEAMKCSGSNASGAFGDRPNRRRHRRHRPAQYCFEASYVLLSHSDRRWIPADLIVIRRPVPPVALRQSGRS